VRVGGLRWPTLGAVCLRWVVWAYVGWCGPTLGGVGLRWPSLAVVGYCGPSLAFGVDGGWWKTHPRLVFASEEGGVGAGCRSSKNIKKNNKKNIYIKKTRTYGPKRRIWRRLGPVFASQPIQTLFVVVKHK
jgi:hypothetical protein